MEPWCASVCVGCTCYANPEPASVGSACIVAPDPFRRVSEDLTGGAYVDVGRTPYFCRCDSPSLVLPNRAALRCQPHRVPCNIYLLLSVFVVFHVVGDILAHVSVDPFLVDIEECTCDHSSGEYSHLLWIDVFLYSSVVPDCRVISNMCPPNHCDMCPRATTPSFHALGVFTSLRHEHECTIFMPGRLGISLRPGPT